MLRQHRGISTAGKTQRKQQIGRNIEGITYRGSNTEKHAYHVNSMGRVLDIRADGPGSNPGSGMTRDIVFC